MPVDVPNKSPGDDLFAREVNEMVRNINALLGTKGPNTIVDSSGVHQRKTTPTGSKTGVFRFKSFDTDRIICRTWDGTTEGSEDIAVALPFLLRKTPFDGETVNGITYTYISTTLRDATDGTITERQSIVPRYFTNDIIYATSMTSHDVIISGQRLLLQELNVDGRQWARFR